MIRRNSAVRWKDGIRKETRRPDPRILPTSDVPEVRGVEVHRRDDHRVARYDVVRRGDESTDPARARTTGDRARGRTRGRESGDAGWCANAACAPLEVVRAGGPRTAIVPLGDPSGFGGEGRCALRGSERGEPRRRAFRSGVGAIGAALVGATGAGRRAQVDADRGDRRGSPRFEGSRRRSPSGIASPGRATTTFRSRRRPLAAAQAGRAGAPSQRGAGGAACGGGRRCRRARRCGGAGPPRCARGRGRRRGGR